MEGESCVMYTRVSTALAPGGNERNYAKKVDENCKRVVQESMTVYLYYHL